MSTVTNGSEGVTLTVANDGPPISADERERIFEPFMRLDEARSLDSRWQRSRAGHRAFDHDCTRWDDRRHGEGRRRRIQGLVPTRACGRMNFGALALMIAAGLIGPLLAAPHRFCPPVVVGEIAAGMVIGTSGFNWVDPTDPVLTGLAAIGFALLMFVVGTHLPVRDPRLRTVAVSGSLIAASVAVLAIVAGEIMSHLVGLDRPAILAVLLATSSGAVALPVLQGLGRHDHAILVTTAWIAIADVATVLALPLVLANGRLGRVLLGGALVVASGVVIFSRLAPSGHTRRRGGCGRCRTTAAGDSICVSPCWRCSRAHGWQIDSARRS